MGSEMCIRDRPFTTLLFRTIGIDRPFFHHSIVSDDMYRYVLIDLSPFYVSVLESNGAPRQSVSVQSTLNYQVVRQSSSTPHAPLGQQRIPEYGAVCPCCAVRSLWWMVSTTRWCEAQTCSILERPVCVPSVPSYTLDNTLSNRLLGQQ